MSEEDTGSAHVYLIDDNTRGRSRAPKLLEALARVGMRAVLFDSFSDVREAFHAGRLNIDALFCLDNILAKEPGPSLDFHRTVPALEGFGVDLDHILPAASAYNGADANQILFPMRFLGKNVLPHGQDALAYGGFEHMDPEGVAHTIKEYYLSLHPEIGEGAGPLR